MDTLVICHPEHIRFAQCKLREESRLSNARPTRLRRGRDCANTAQSDNREGNCTLCFELSAGRTKVTWQSYFFVFLI